MSHNAGLKSLVRRNSINRTETIGEEEKSFIQGLLYAVLTDVSQSLHVPEKHVRRDISYINKRVSHESISFLTVTLPSLGKAVLAAFQEGELRCPSAFKRLKGTALPAFLQGLLILCFYEDGRLREDALPVVVESILQICFIYYKYRVNHDWRTERDMLTGMIEVDNNLPRSFPQGCFSDPMGENVLYVAQRLLLGLFSHGKGLSYIVPRHGPGACADKEIREQHEKFRFRRFHKRLERSYPQADYATPAGIDAAKAREGCNMPSELPLPARVLCVPKDSRGPRVISAEDPNNMWIQQGQFRYLVELCEKHPLTRGHINFRDQTINGKLAREASLTGKWATLDMKEASDRVSVALTHALLPGRIFAQLYATRSTHSSIRIPIAVDKNGRVSYSTVIHKLWKFAPMGSAVCFPLESIVFWTLCVATLITKFRMDDKKASSLVFTFGDDLIVPAVCAEAIMDSLEQFGLLFNRQKSFLRGPFRESCGVEAFKGEDVTPIRIKTRLPHEHQDTSGTVAWVEYSNAFHMKGYWGAAHYIKQYIETLLSRELPILPKDSGGLGWASFCKLNPADDWLISDETVQKLTSVSLAARLDFERNLTEAYGLKLSDLRVAKNTSRTYGTQPESQGIFMEDVLSIRAVTYRPSRKTFGESDAYLRFVTESGRNGLYLDEHEGDRFGVKPTSLSFTGNARVFGRRYQTRWCKIRVTLS